jgi:hypothetical protein
MPLDLADYERKTREAEMAFLGNGEKAKWKALEAGCTHQGERAGVTSAKSMDGFAAVIIDLVNANGLGHASIHLERKLLTLRGYFRPARPWDICVCRAG